MKTLKETRESKMKKTKLGSDYALKMSTRFGEKVKEKKRYSRTDRAKNKIDIRELQWK